MAKISIGDKVKVREDYPDRRIAGSIDTVFNITGELARMIIDNRPVAIPLALLERVSNYADSRIKGSCTLSMADFTEDMQHAATYEAQKHGRMSIVRCRSGELAIVHGMNPHADRIESCHASVFQVGHLQQGSHVWRCFLVNAEAR